MTLDEILRDIRAQRENEKLNNITQKQAEDTGRRLQNMKNQASIISNNYNNLNNKRANYNFAILPAIKARVQNKITSNKANTDYKAPTALEYGVDKAGEVMDSLGFGLSEGIVKPVAKATIKGIDNYSARKKALEEINPNMTWLDKYIEIQKDSKTDDINNFLDWADKNATNLSKNKVLSSILLGTNKKINNEDSAKKIFLGSIIPENYKLKDIIDERPYRKFTNEEIQEIVDKSADEVAPNKTARGVGNLGYEGVKMGVSIAQPGLAPLVYGTTGALEKYGETDDPNKIIASGVKDASYGTLMRGTSNLVKNGLTKVIPGVGEKLLPTIATNFGANAIGGASASAITDIGTDLITGEKIDTKQVGRNALESGLMSGVIGGTMDTVADVKTSRAKLNKDVNDTIENLQNINRQITEGDASISKNPKIVNKLLAKGQKEIDKLASNSYLMSNKAKREAVLTLQTAYNNGYINDVKKANENLIKLLGTAEMNLEASQNSNKIRDINKVVSKENVANTQMLEQKNNNINSVDSNLKSDLVEKVNSIKSIDNDTREIFLNTINKTDSSEVLENIRNDLQNFDNINEEIKQGETSNSTAISINRNEVIKQNYKKYANAKIDDTIVKNAQDLVPTNTQGRRTKEQWLKVAEQIGSNVTEQQAEMYAYKTWLDMKPNNKENLNRQGKSYVKFTLDEWIDKVKEANNKNGEIAEIKTAIPFMEETNLAKRPNIIDEKVEKYIESVKDNFETDIDISTKVVNEGNVIPVDYKNEKQTTIYKRARDIFGKIGKKVFTNKNDSEKIYVSNTDINESIRKTITNPDQNKYLNENMSVFSQLDKIIENGKEISSSIEDAKGRDFYRDWKYYISNVKIDGKAYVVEYDTVISENDKRRHFRLERVYELNEGDLATGSNINSVNQFGTKSPSINNIIPRGENYVNNSENSQKSIKVVPVGKVLDPMEIANMKKEDASSTPTLPDRNYKKGDRESRFYKNVTENSRFLSKEMRNELKTNEDIKYYKGITNEETLNKALQKLESGGKIETENWLSKNENFTAQDVAEGWILLKRYQDVGDTNMVANIAKKMRYIGTNSGQAVQAFNIFSRLTPEGMKLYAQQQLNEQFEKFSKNKTKEWIMAHEKEYQLTNEEYRNIEQKILEAQKLENDSYEKKVKLGEIAKIISDKLPTEKGAKIKSWMRMSMLFNPKTQVRNVAGNAIIAPVNAVGDVFASMADKAIAKKTGVRTTGNINIKATLKGIKDGAYQATNDYKLGINTKDMEGNRFEIATGKSFSEKNIIGRSLNRVESLLNYVMDVGDRLFSQSSFENSLQNQMKLNNTTEVTQDMIDIARSESLQRTWNDNNGYTKFVLEVRRNFNKLHYGQYGLGDVLIPFAKTPANLTKAIVDYSPAGLVNTIIEGNNLRKAIGRGDFTSQQQHKFVQDLGKATAGTLLYVAGYALAKAGITSGESDEDKDVSNFMRNTLGISSYSIKIGDKSFTYDWAQPIAAPLSIMANIVNSNNKGNALYEAIVANLDTAGSILLEQSFLSSINDVLTDNDGIVSGLVNEILELPSRAVPTFMKQVADMVDPITRTTYENGKPVDTAINKLKAKIPFVSKSLAPTRDTLGNEVKKYGGNNSLFNVFLNPANINSNISGTSAKEIYRLYEKTGDKTIFPRVANSYLTYDGERYNLDSHEKSEYQRQTGEYVNNVIKNMLEDENYKKLTDAEKLDIVKEVVSDSNEYAKENYAQKYKLKYERQKTDVKIDKQIGNGLSITNAYIYKTIISKIEGEKGKEGSTITNKSKYIMNMKSSDEQKNLLLDLTTDSDSKPKVEDLKKLNGDYLTYMQQSGKKNDEGVSQRDKYMMYVDTGIPVKTLNKYYAEIGKIEGVKDSNGKTISGSKKKAIFNYINSLPLSTVQKKILFTKSNASYGKSYKREIFNYINRLPISKARKEQIWKELYY